MVLIVWSVLLGLGVLAVAVPGIRHWRRTRAWDRELAVAFAQTGSVDPEGAA